MMTMVLRPGDKGEYHQVVQTEEGEFVGDVYTDMFKRRTFHGSLKNGQARELADLLDPKPTAATQWQYSCGCIEQGEMVPIECEKHNGRLLGKL